MTSYLGMIIWQFAVFGLIAIAAVCAIWVSRQYRQQLGQTLGYAGTWVAVSSVCIGLAMFTFLAIFFGYVMDSVVWV